MPVTAPHKVLNFLSRRTPAAAPPFAPLVTILMEAARPAAIALELDEDSSPPNYPISNCALWEASCSSAALNDSPASSFSKRAKAGLSTITKWTRPTTPFRIARPHFDDHHYVSESFHLVTTTIALDPRVGVLRKLKFVALSIALCIAQYTVLFTLAHSLLYGRCTDGVECALGFFCSEELAKAFPEALDAYVPGGMGYCMPCGGWDNASVVLVTPHLFNATCHAVEGCADSDGDDDDVDNVNRSCSAIERSQATECASCYAPTRGVYRTMEDQINLARRTMAPPDWVCIFLIASVLVFCLEGELRDVRLSEIHSKRLILNSAAGGDGISWAPILCGSIPGWVPWRMLIFVIGWLRRYLVVYGVISWFFLSISTVLDGSISKSLVATGVQMLFLIDVDEMLLNYLLVGSFKNAFEGGTTVATTPSDERALAWGRNAIQALMMFATLAIALFAPELMTGVGRYYLDSVGYFGHGLPSQVSTSLLTTSGFHAGAIVWVSHTIEKAARGSGRGDDSRASQLSRILRSIAVSVVATTPQIFMGFYVASIVMAQTILGNGVWMQPIRDGTVWAP